MQFTTVTLMTCLTARGTLSPCKDEHASPFVTTIPSASHGPRANLKLPGTGELRESVPAIGTHLHDHRKYHPKRRRGPTADHPHRTRLQRRQPGLRAGSHPREMLTVLSLARGEDFARRTGTRGTGPGGRSMHSAHRGERSSGAHAHREHCEAGPRLTSLPQPLHLLQLRGGPIRPAPPLTSFVLRGVET